MELREILRIVRRWVWLLILGAVLGGVATYFFSIYQTPVYESSAEVFISQPKYNELSELGYLNIYQMIPTYAELMVTDSVLGETGQRLDGVVDPGQVSVQQVRDTQLLRVTVEDINPVSAANIANTLVTVFSEQQYELQTARYAESKQNLEASLAEQQKIIDDLLTQLSEISDSEEYRVDRERLNLMLVQAKETYSNLVNNYESLRLTEAQSVSTVQLVESAKPYIIPVRPNVTINTLLGVAVGLMLAGGIVFLVEYLDDTVRSLDDITKEFELTALGYIAKIPTPRKKKGDEGVYIFSNPRSPIAEAFRSLRTNIEFAGVVEPIKTILVTSPGPQEGKSTVTANLAAVMHQGGKRVVVVDGDMRRPRLHKIFGMNNLTGLSSLFRGQANITEVIVKRMNNLFVLTSGAVPPNPAELLGSKIMDRILASVLGMGDIVIIDSPPLVVTDPVVLSTKVDGVILVINPGKTKREALKAAMLQFERSDARILGVVVNQIGKNTAYYYEHYYSPQYYQAEDQIA